MECFNVFWSRPFDERTSWFLKPKEYRQPSENQPKLDDYFSKIVSHPFDLEYEPPLTDCVNCQSESRAKTMENDLREVLRVKAAKHSVYYQKLVEPCVTDTKTRSDDRSEMAVDNKTTSRQRRRGVYEMEGSVEDKVEFRSVKTLKEKYQAMLEETAKNLKEMKTVKANNSDDVFLLAPPSGYCSSSASGASDDEKDRSWAPKAQVRRSGSSDSAVGLTQSDEEITNLSFDSKKYDPLYTQQDSVLVSPYSPRGSVDHVNVPTKTLIEAQYIPAPLDRKFSECGSDIDGAKSDSRRQSCFTDDGEEGSRYRYWRTPSVVVSDYSDDVIGLTLDEIEYFRNQRKENSSSPESSLHSSCSNLNYCGSTISSLDAERLLRKPYRKESDCSLYSLSGDENDDDYKDELKSSNSVLGASGWRKLRNIVQWTPFFQTYKKQRYPWVQLAGHQGNFKAGPDQGTILKKLCAKEEKCFKILMKDRLRPYVPEYKGLITSDDGECSYLQLQDLLGDFVSPCVMDCKIGVRTYLEEELAKAKEKPKLRKDMYDKMCQIDSNAPTEEEHRLKGVTKPRYMVWRETISSTATLGFRIEGIRRADGTSSKDFKTTKTREQIIQAFIDFTDGFPHAVPKYIQRLKAIKATLESSDFFNSHEVIGSSLLFVHDKYMANVWLIDFAKTILLPSEISIDHNSKWKVGNHEDGYLIGVNNLISIFKTLLEQQPVSITPPLILKDPPELPGFEAAQNEEKEQEPSK